MKQKMTIATPTVGKSTPSKRLVIRREDVRILKVRSGLQTGDGTKGADCHKPTTRITDN